MSSPFLLLLMAYAAVGLVASLTVHILSLFGITLGGQWLFIALHVGIFPLWFPVVLLMQKATNGMTKSYGFSQRRKTWQVMFSGCPTWMKYMTQVFFYYAIVNFIIFVFVVPTGKSSGAPPPSVWHGFSGHWMAFYSAGLAMATTAYYRGVSNLIPSCSNGHPVAWGSGFCPTCGVTLSEHVRTGP